MAYKKSYKKAYKKRKGPTKKQKAAYWIGVGLSAGRDSRLRSDLLGSSPLKKHIQAGYEADNY